LAFHSPHTAFRVAVRVKCRVRLMARRSLIKTYWQLAELGWLARPIRGTGCIPCLFINPPVLQLPLSLQEPRITWIRQRLQLTTTSNNMKPDSRWSFRRSSGNVGRRIKDAFKSSSSQPSLSSANTLPTQNLPIVTPVSPSSDPLPSAPIIVQSVTSQHRVNVSHTPPAQPLLATNFAPASHTNVPISMNPPPSASAVQTAKGAGSMAWVGLETALRVLKESSDMLPPLKSAVSGLLGCLGVLQVSAYDSII
jgi:hypothetical protein